MYERFYGFRDRPFRLTPDPAYLFLSRTHREAYAHLLYGIRENVGFVSITGEIGAGKTTLVRAAIRETGEQASVAYIFDPVLSSIDLLQTINAEFGLPHRSVSKRELSAVLNDYLIGQRAEGKRSVVVIDEAQNLRPAVLEQLRLLSNLETDTEKLLQIVLLGQPELRALFERPELAQLSQRMSVRWHIRPLGEEETADYLGHRITVAGGENVFDEQALAMIYRASGGVPRMINIVAHRALLVGYGKGAQLVGPQEVSKATMELEDGRYGIGARPSSWSRRLAMAAGAALAAGLVAFFLLPPVSDPTVATPASAHAGVERVDAGGISSKLGEADSLETARSAVDRLLELWDARAVSKDERLDLEGLATARGLRYSAFDAGPSLLAILDLPAIVELGGGHDGVRYLLVEAIDRDSYLVHLGGTRTAVAGAELARLWNGNAHMLWRDGRGLGQTLGPASKGQAVSSLQKMLARAGLYPATASGVYDEATEKAVRNFQLRFGLVPDGVAGTVTQMLLYKGDGPNAGPSLRPTT